jgi:putative PIN family toxin of toxin-antitoxin system
MAIVRAVFDTNVLISALLSLTGAPFHCLALARVGTIQLISCVEILNEFREKLETKFNYTRYQAQQAVQELEQICEIVQLSGQPYPIVKDPDDHKVIECAIVGNARYIVSGDKHLLLLKQYEQVHTVSAREFLTILSFDKT